MFRFKDWPLRNKFFSIGIGTLLALSIVFSFLYSASDKKNTVAAYVEKARSICLTAESTRQEMEEKWKLGLFTIEQMREYASEKEQEKLLSAVPVVSAWRAAMRKAEAGGYEFRVPKFEPRNPKNVPDYGLNYQIEAPALNRIKAENLSEFYIIDERINSVRYFLPVRLTDICLNCHGDPKLSQTLWGTSDGTDPTGGTMENWKAGEIHGAFEVVQSLDQADAARMKRMFLAGGLILLFLIGAGIVYFVVAGTITRPIRRSADFAGKMATGDFSQQLDIKQKDEVGALAGAMNHMISEVGQMITEITRSIGTLSGASSDLRDISGQMSEEAEQTSQRSSAVSAAAEQMSANMTNVAAAVEQTSTNVKMVAAAAEEMSATISEIASSSEKSREITQHAVEQAEEASMFVGRLGKAANEIGKVTETITEISDQTNLLALNATIEAARAGEAGKGFAVVANEIKQLANQTSQATLEIRQEIEGIQSSTSDTVEKIGMIGDVISQINEIVTNIASAVEEQSVTTNEIANNVAQASQGIEEVTQNVAESSTAAQEVAKDIAQVDQSSREISQSSSQIQVSAKSLSQLAEELQKLVEHFKV